MLTDLASLLAPAPEGEFLDHYHRKVRMLVRAADPRRAVDLLPWQRIGDIITTDTLPDDRFSIIRDTNRLPAPFFRKGGKERLRPGAVDDLVAQGASIVINHLPPLVPAIGCLTAAVERRLGCRVGCNGYISFGRQSAFRRHWDVHDVLVVQIHGRKKWQFLPGPLPYPLHFDKALLDPAAPPAFETVLQAGDVLYVPRGEVHVAEVLDEPSVHLTLSLTPPRGVDFLDHLRERALEDPVFRMDVLRTLDPPSAAAHEAELKRRLHALIETSSIADFLRADDASRQPLAKICLHAVPPAGRQRLALLLPRRIPLPDHPPGGADLTLVIAGDQHRLPPAAVAALAWLFDHEDATADDLRASLSAAYGPETVDAGLVALLRRGLVVALGDHGSQTR